MLLRQPVGEDRRRHRHHADRLVVDQVERRLRVEALDEHQLGALAQHPAEHGVEAVDVEQREHPEHHVVAVDHRRLDLGGLVDVGDQRPVSEHRGARAGPRYRWCRAGRPASPGRAAAAPGTATAARERVVGLLALGRLGADDVHPRLVRAAHQVGVELVGLAGAGGADQVGGRAHGPDRLLVGDHDAAAGVGDHPRELAGRGPGVHRYGDHLRAQHPEVRRHELDPVAHRQQDPLPGHQPGRAEAGRDPRDLVLEPGPGDAASRGLDHGQRVGPVAAASATSEDTSWVVGMGAMIPQRTGAEPACPDRLPA